MDWTKKLNFLFDELNVKNPNILLTRLCARIEERACCFDGHRADGSICDLSTWITTATVSVVVSRILLKNIKLSSCTSINVLWFYLRTSSLCELWRRKFRQRIISSVVLWRRNPRDIRISSVVDWRRMAGRELSSGGGGGRAHGLGSLGKLLDIKIKTILKLTRKVLEKLEIGSCFKKLYASFKHKFVLTSLFFM